MRVLRVLNVGGFFLSMVFSGVILLSTTGCEGEKKDGTTVPATDPAKIAAEKDAREKFMKDGGNKAAAPKK